MNSTLKTVGVVSIFSAAMAALEGAVVVYLRALYYPDAFTVSFKIIDSNILLVEIVREVATLIMLLAVAYVAGKNFRERFAYFLLSFAVWDILYYGWLKVFIDWPSSFFDWDILFLTLRYFSVYASRNEGYISTSVTMYDVVRLSPDQSRSLALCRSLNTDCRIFTRSSIDKGHLEISVDIKTSGSCFFFSSQPVVLGKKSHPRLLLWVV